jgi:hypothetical protein
MAKSFNIDEIPRTATTSALRAFVGLLVQTTSLSIRSVYAIGSCVSELLIGGMCEDRDIDVVFFTEEDLARGARLLSDLDTDDVIEKVREMTGIELGISHNGIPEDTCAKTVIDVIPARMSDISGHFPQVVIDMCNRDNIHVAGTPVLEPLMNMRVTPEMVADRIRVTIGYVEREQDRLAEKGALLHYIRKSIGFAVKMAHGIGAMSETPGEEAIRFLDTSGMTESLREKCEEVVDECERGTKGNIVPAFKTFGDALSDVLRATGFLTEV